MTHFESWLLGYLFNSLWQVPLIGAVAWLAATALREHGAATVHRVWVCAQILETVVPGCSAQPSRWLDRLLTLVGRGSPTHIGDVSVVIGAGSEVGGFHLPHRFLAGVVAAYCLVLAYFVVRLIWGIQTTRSIRHRSSELVLTGVAASCWRNCCGSFDIHDAHISTSDCISSPMTMGIRRRFVLLPDGTMERLSEEDFQAVIAHEFVHMRRRDFAWNLFYELFSLPIAYHPALWLTRSRLAETREIVCDEIAAEAVAGRDEYARSLLRLASLFIERTTIAAPHAIGIFDANTLERRVMKLTAYRKQLHWTRRVATLAACALCGLGICVSALALHAGVSLPYSDKAAPSTNTTKPTTVPAGEMAGHVRKKVTPVYPKAAKEAKIQGAVVLNAMIGKDGTIMDLQVVSGPKELLGSAIDAVRQWTYDPYLANGEPAEVNTTITVHYSLAN